MIVRAEFVQCATENEELRREYWHAARSFPLELVEVKCRGFVPLLGLSHTYYWVHSPNCGLDPNDYELTAARSVRAGRECAFRVAHWVSGHRLWRWVSGVHLVWLAATVAALAVTLVQYRRRPSAAARFQAFLLLMPLAYYLGYLLATTAADFRYMYPATLLMQGYVVAAAIAGAYHLRRRSTGGGGDR
ncbi:MAG: hypothetical protein KAY37_12910 [Phycisphaerae bacterium]|nr:hypothetical protein [Phycisphaerae bacterium]